MPFGCNRNFDFWYHFCRSDISFQHTYQGLFMTSWKFGMKKNNLILYGLAVLKVL